MALDNFTTQLVGLIGGVAGLLSLGILLTKYVLEKPNLKIIIEQSFYNPPESHESNFSIFFIGLRIENKGRRNTTVHSFDLTFDYKNKTYSPPLIGGSEVIINADDTKRINLQFGLQKRQFVVPEGDIEDAILKIAHTFNKKTIEISKIKQGYS